MDPGDAADGRQHGIVEPSGPFDKSTASVMVSIVVYRSSLRVLDQTLHCLHRASQWAHTAGEAGVVEIAIIDNASGAAYVAALVRLVRRWQAAGMRLRLVAGQENPGYGGGHNRAAVAKFGYRLVLNPDVFLQQDSLCRALAFLRTHPEVGMVVPRVVDETGKVVYLCKRYPGVMTLLLRGFAPEWLRRRFSILLSRYEMRDLDWDQPRFDLELVSGCCLLMRSSVWERLGGFDPGYFLYFEDFDLALRAREITQMAYVPDFVVTHLGGGAARKGWRHRWWFMRSAWRFFHRHGWRWV